MEKYDPLAGCGTTCFRVRPPGVHTIENRRKGRKSRQQRIHHFLLSAYIFVDMDKLVLRYAGAGHPPLLIAPRNAHIQKSESREIEENGSMLGLFPEATYCSVEIQLDAGDRILLYADGILEVMNAAREEFGKSRLKEFLAASTSSASHFADALLLELRRWSGADAERTRDDDITLLILDFQTTP